MLIHMLRYNYNIVLFGCFKLLRISTSIRFKVIFVCLFLISGFVVKSRTLIKPVEYQFSIPDYRHSFYAYPYTRYYQQYCRDNKVRIIEGISKNNDSTLQISHSYFNKSGYILKDSIFSVNGHQDTFIKSIVFRYLKQKKGLIVTEEERRYVSKNKSLISIYTTITHFNEYYMPDSVIKMPESIIEINNNSINQYSTSQQLEVYHFRYNSKNELIYSIVKRNNKIDTIELRKYDFSSEALYAYMGAFNNIDSLKNHVEIVDVKAGIRALFCTINSEKIVTLVKKTLGKSYGEIDISESDISFTEYEYLSYNKVGNTYSQDYIYSFESKFYPKGECVIEYQKTFANNKLQYKNIPILYKMFYYE